MEAKTKYPKGPWKDDGYGFIKNEAGVTVTDSPEIDSNECEYATPGTKTLILAAPAMLDHIKSLVDYIEAITCIEDDGARCTRFHDDADLRDFASEDDLQLAKGLIGSMCDSRFTTIPTNSQR